MLRSHERVKGDFLYAISATNLHTCTHSHSLTTLLVKHSTNYYMNERFQSSRITICLKNAIYATETTIPRVYCLLSTHTQNTQQDMTRWINTRKLI